MSQYNDYFIKRDGNLIPIYELKNIIGFSEDYSEREGCYMAVVSYQKTRSRKSLTTAIVRTENGTPYYL
jgi:hypothetical protein